MFTKANKSHLRLIMNNKFNLLFEELMGGSIFEKLIFDQLKLLANECYENAETDAILADSKVEDGSLILNFNNDVNEQIAQIVITIGKTTGQVFISAATIQEEEPNLFDDHSIWLNEINDLIIFENSPLAEKITEAMNTI
jgi:hypothetical protein